MKGEFIILVVCAALVHISLVEISPATAAIPKETIDDLDLLRSYQRVSILQVQKVIEYIFPKNLQDCLVKGGLSDGDSNGNNLTVIETCTSKLLYRGVGVIDSTLSIASMVAPQTFPALMSAHVLAVDGLIDLFKDVCTGWQLAVDKHSSTAAAQIRAMADKQVAAAATFNKPYFDAIRASQSFQPELEDIFEKYEKQSTSALANAFNETFNGIQEFALLGGLEGVIEEILSLFETYRKRAIAESLASLGAKFTIAEAVFTSSKIFQSVENFHSRENENFTATAALAAEKGISSVFNTILHLENQNDAYKTANNETSVAYISALRAAFRAISKLVSECSLLVEVEATSEFKIKKMVDDFYKNFTPRTSESELQTMEEELSQIVSEVVDDLYTVVQQCILQPPPTNRQSGLLNLGLPSLRLQKSPSLLGLNLNLNLDNLLGLVGTLRAKSLANTRKPFTTFFNGIKDRIANPTSGILAGGKIVVPLMNLQPETSSGVKDILESAYESIIMGVKVFGKSDTDIAEALSEIEICRQQTRLGIDEGMGVVFRFITAITQNGPQDNPSEFIEAGRVATSTAYSTALRSVFRGFEFAITNTTSVAEKEALSLLLRAVDAIYRAIQGAQSNPCEILENFTDTEEAITQDFSLVSFKFYDEIRRSPRYNVTNEPALSRIQYESIARTNGVAATIFGRIRSLAAANCPESEVNSNDDSSPITTGHDHASSELAKIIGSYFSALALISGESTGNIADPPIKTKTTRVAVTRTIEY